MERLTKAELRRVIETHIDEVLGQCIETGGLLLWHGLEVGFKRAAECIEMGEFEARQHLRLTRAYIDLRNRGLADDQAIQQLIQDGHARHFVEITERAWGWLTYEAVPITGKKPNA